MDFQNNDEAGAPRKASNDARGQVCTPMSLPARQRTPWGSRAPFAEPADAPYREAHGAPKAAAGVGLSKATRCGGPGIVRDV